MKSGDILTGHPTADELIAHLYGAGGDDGHLRECEICRQRLDEMVQSRAALQAESPADGPVTSDLLAQQRRAIYRKIDEANAQGGMFSSPRRWAAAVCGVAVVSMAGWMWEQSTEVPQPNRTRAQQVRVVAVSDEQLVDDASEVAESAEPKAAAPLKALFEN